MDISRRTLLAAAAVPLTGVAAACAKQRTARFYVTPAGGGDGSSWEQGASLATLDELLRNVAPGGEILIAADRGEYTVAEAIELSAGGAEEGAVRVRGVSAASGEPMAALIRGVRAGAEMGGEAFRLRRGANHLHFSHFDFRAIGNGCFRVGGPISGLTVEDCVAEDVYRFFENTASDNENQASLQGFAIRRCRGARVERGFLRIRYRSRDGVIEDCTAGGLANEGGHIPAGCALDDRASNITYRRCVMENFQQWRAGEYWNGDGFSDEEQNAGIRYEACQARGSTDGGFDCKSRDVVLEDCVAEDNKRNFRLWSEHATLTGCTSRNPNFRGRDAENASPCHIWIGGEDGARVEIAGLTVADADATAIFEFEHDDARAEVRGLAVESPRRNWNASVQERDGIIIARQD